MVDVAYIPQRGDLLWISLNPTEGHEQAGRRPVLVISPTEFNRFMRLAIMCVITNRIRGRQGFEVPLPSGLKTSGVILVHQVRCMAYRERGAEFIERVPTAVTEEVEAKLTTLISDD